MKFNHHRRFMGWYEAMVARLVKGNNYFTHKSILTSINAGQKPSKRNLAFEITRNSIRNAPTSKSEARIFCTYCYSMLSKYPVNCFLLNDLLVKTVISTYRDRSVYLLIYWELGLIFVSSCPNLSPSELDVDYQKYME